MSFTEQSSCPCSSADLHVAIIMDGNGRWATRRGNSRTVGHRTGAQVLDQIVAAAPRHGVSVLTLFVLSSDNWQRPRAEVDGLLDLFGQFLAKHTPTPDLFPKDTAPRNGASLPAELRLSVVGRRDRLSSSLRERIEAAERGTESAPGLHLRLAVDYSSRDAILDAMRRIPKHELTRERLEQCLANPHGGPPALPVDLLIRTGGEQRLSDFLLWECAYAELLFLETLWPDFTEAHLGAAIDSFRARSRRFGSVEHVCPAPTPDSTSSARSLS